MSDDRGDWLSLVEAARLAGVGRTTLHDAAARGEVAFATIGRVRFFAREDVEAWRRERCATEQTTRAAW